MPSRPTGTKRANADRLAKAVASALVDRERTISDLAASAEVSRVVLSKWINGHRTISVSHLERLLRALGRLEVTAQAIARGPAR
jgi:transcriptional regulator with XRE-family HTH domain